MLQNPSFRPPDDLQASKEAGDVTGQQTPVVGLPTTPRRTCSIHKGGYCCLASPQFQDFIAGYALGSSFVGDSEQQQNSSSSSVEPASTVMTTSASASGSTLDVLATAAATATPGVEGAGVSPAVSAVPLVAESVSSSSSEGTMKTNLVTSDISARTRGKPTSIMVKRMPADTSSPSLSPGLPPTNHSAPSLPLTPTSVLSYTPTPVSTLAFASRSLHDLPSSSSIAAATAFANLTPKARRRTFDSFALADENAARRDWKAINPPYKAETLPSRSGGISAGNLRRATISGSGGMSYYGMGRDASAARWSKLMEAARSEDDARAGLNQALNNEGARPKPTRRKTVQIYEPIKSSPLVPKPSPSPSPPPKEEMMTTSTDTLSLPASSVSPMSLSVSPTPSLSTITTQSQTVPSIVVSSAETDSTSTAQQQSSSPPVSALASVSVPAVHRTIPPSPSGPPPEPPKEVTLAVKLFGPPPVPVSVLRAQTPQGHVQTTLPASVPPPPSPPTAPPIQTPSPSTQVVPTAPTMTAVMPTPAIMPQTTTVVATPPPTAPTVTLPTPTNHVHLSRRTYIPPHKHTSFLSRLFSPFSHGSHGSRGNSGSSSTASHSTSVLQPPTFTSTKHPPSSSSHGASGGGGGGLGRDITGTFVIDPLLVLPKGLFRAFSDDTFVGLSSTPTPSSEFIGGGGGGGNRGSGVGGIEGGLRDDSDADVGVGGGLRLKRSRSFDGSTPTPNRGAFSRYHHGRMNRPSIAEAVEAGGNGVGGRGGGQGEKEKEKKNLKLEVENGGIDVDVHVIPTPVATNINGRRTRVQGTESGLQKKRTTIELNLLSPTINSRERGRGRGGKSGQQQVPEFPLIARIHAKSPRQPLHITARTYTPPPRTSSPTNESTPAVLAMPAAPPQPPSTKLLSPPPPPPPPPLPPPPPPTHPRTSPLPFSTSPIPTSAVERPPSPTSSIHTTHTSRTTQTTYTARTTVTNITTPTATLPAEEGAGTGKGATGPKRSASTGRKLKKKRPSQRQQQKRMPTLTPYYYSSADEAVAAGGIGVVGRGMEDTREGVENVGTDIRGEDGGGGVEETSAPPYTRTHEPHESSEVAADHRRPPDPYDLVNPIKPTRTPNTAYANNPPPALPAPVPAPIPAPLPPMSHHNDSIDDKNLKNFNSNKKQQPRLIMDSSNLTLSIPRTFHGPLSIHVQAGNLDEHIELSDALQRECVLVKEGRSARGLFVGDFRKEFGFDWGGGGVGAEGTEDVENTGGKGESEEEVLECVCGAGEEVEVVVGDIREVEMEMKAKVKVGEVKKVKRKPVVGFSTTAMNGNPDLHPGSEEPNPVNSTSQTTTLHKRAKSNPPFGTSPVTPIPPTHGRSQSIPSGLPFPTSSRDPSLQGLQLQPHRPSFLDVDPESLIHRTNSGGSNGLGQIGWKMTKVQNVNGRVRVVSEHQPIMKSPLQNGGALAPLAPVPPVPPLPKGQGQTQTPAWVMPKSGLPGNNYGVGSIKERQRSMAPEDGDGELHVRRVSIERKVFNPVCGWEDSGSPTRTYVNANGEVGGGDAEDSSSSGGGGGGGGSVEEVKRRRRASAPATSTMMTDGGGKRKCTCGARTRTRSTAVECKTRNGDIGVRRGGRTEWMGDRIDISIGGGRVKLLYDDESVDAFVPIGGVGVVGVVEKEKKRWWKFGKGG